ncbi:MAG: transglutaminase-like domain-containing protein [Thiohalocapsa sp.]|uniref:hypothetical protein n=1 Tax=Thiohalocapsa sp. TaxID=2497641 RepID=UPI002600C8AA|nr:hypothetical protein [Thiohalocapsa sp.]MCG6940502.1 transglutaminase-like domain-containing protein [Thiohalocapsa sp.]
MPRRAFLKSSAALAGAAMLPVGATSALASAAPPASLSHDEPGWRLFELTSRVRETARRITADRDGDLAKARAIYDGVVENTFRDPAVRGCGLGDIRFMLETRNLREMNWLAYNDAHDLALPGSEGAALPYLMYPQAEVNGERLDPLDPASFRYQLRSRELTA